ncbi:MAG: cell division FtsA domain-containing protein, partial [Minisyncoccales bacterium]
GTFISSFKNRALISVSRSDGIIPQEDIERVSKEAEISRDSFNKELVEILEEKFFLDGQAYFEIPLGFRAAKLEKEILGTQVISSYFKTFNKAFFASDFAFDDFVSFPLSLSTIPSEKEKEIGVTVVDFGHQTTSFCLMKDGKIIDFFVLPIGSSEISKEIALNFKISYEDAEIIKCEYGDAYFRGKDKKEQLEIDNDFFSLSQKKLSQLIQAVLWDIFRQPFLNLKETFNFNKMAGGIIFIGGGAKLKNFVDFLKRKIPFYLKLKNYSKIDGLENDISFAKCEGALISLLKKKLPEKNFSGKLKQLLKKIF